MHTPILHGERKTILKALALAIAVCVVPVCASAADLVVGVVHDTDGYPVAGAQIALHDTAGGPAGSGVTAADGTFAIDAGPDVSTVEIRCAYCLRMTVARVAGAPVVALVRRFAALRDRGISAADARVLPYASVLDEATLMPFTVSKYGWLSDRGLDDALGAVVSDGFGLYRSTDGVDLGTAIPAHGAATIQAGDPALANAYGSESSGGVFYIDTLDQSAGLARFDASSADDLTLRAGNALRGAFETSGGPNAETRTVVDGSLPSAAGTLDLRAIDASGMGANASGFSSTLVTPVGGSALTTSLSMTRSVDGDGPEHDDIAALSLQSGGLTYGVRAARTSGFVEDGIGVQDDARAYVEAAHDNGYTRLFASLTAALSSETLLGSTSVNGGLLPTLTASTRLGADFAVHADSVDSLIEAPLYLVEYLPNEGAVDRSHLLDAGLGFDDADRLRIDAMVFRQTVTGPAYGTTGGSGISTIWQIAPSLALRSWVLVSHNYSSIYGPGLGNLDRSATWLTAGNVLRVDAIWRGPYLEGDVSIPAGAQARFVAGTRREGPNRVVTAGISWP